jgi:hypothetical protein
MLDGQRLGSLMLYGLGVDQGYDALQILICIVHVGDIYLFPFNKHAKVLADKLDRPVGRRPVTLAHGHHSIAAQRAQHPERVNTPAE